MPRASAASGLLFQLQQMVHEILAGRCKPAFAAGQPDGKRSCCRISPGFGEHVLQDDTSLGRRLQQPVHPAPGFGVVVLRQQACIDTGFEPLQVGLPCALKQLARQPIQPINKTAGSGKRIWPVV